jgi:hypothetical protein
MCHRVLRSSLASHISRCRGKILLQPDIDGMLDVTGKARRSAPDVEHFFVGRD